MKHARSDYDSIQDLAQVIQPFPIQPTSIEDDEPVFLIRAKDVVAPEAVEYWARLAARQGADPLIVETARRWADTMREWQAEHGVKVPDMPSPLPPANVEFYKEGP